jgi:hypothetical protein
MKSPERESKETVNNNVIFSAPDYKKTGQRPPILNLAL